MSRQDVIKFAQEEIGTREDPPNSNRTRYGVWYGLDGVKWCAIFVSWVYHHSGHPLGKIDRVNGFQLCQAGYRFWRRHNLLTNRPESGDIVLFDWNGDGIAQHVGLFESWNGNSKDMFYCIEGNTALGNDSDGGSVMRRRRSVRSVMAFACPLDHPIVHVLGDREILAAGSRSARVATLQRRLKMVGYELVIDGIFGRATVAAVRSFQEKTGIEETGKVDDTTWAGLEEYVVLPRNVGSNQFTQGSFLRRGNSGAAVHALQKALNRSVDNTRLNEDGIYGSQTIVAVKRFQSQNGLHQDGVAGPETLYALGMALI